MIEKAFERLVTGSNFGLLWIFRQSIYLHCAKTRPTQLHSQWIGFSFSLSLSIKFENITVCCQLVVFDRIFINEMID